MVLASRGLREDSLLLSVLGRNIYPPNRNFLEVNNHYSIRTYRVERFNDEEGYLEFDTDKTVFHSTYENRKTALHSATEIMEQISAGYFPED